MLKVQILSNNQTTKPKILAEHGLALLIELDNHKLLFDTGQSDLIMHNAKMMGLDPASVDALIISHGHYDHTGGVCEFARYNSKAKFYLHPKAFVPRFNKGKEEQIGIRWQRTLFQKRIVWVEKPHALGPDIILTGEVPQFVPLERTPFLKLEDNKLVEDYIIDEQLLLVRGERGIYIFVGCCHLGLENALTVAARLFPGEKIAAVIGGLHLKAGGVAAAKLLKDHGVEFIVPLHCTGFEAAWDLKRAFGANCLLSGAGEQLRLET